MNENGRLYLCATPIGNLGDITYRAVELLRTADLIAAEDTRHTRGLLAHYDIHTPMTSYHEHNKDSKGPELIARMQAGETIVCVSDAGLPGIADPGSDLAHRAIAKGIPVTPLPGANAALSALICAGLSLEGFTFVGFLPRKEKKRRELLARVAAYPETLIFYEAPHRLRETLDALAESLGRARQACAARELVIVVAGADENAAADDGEEMSLIEHYAAHIAAGLDKKEAMRRTAQERGISRRDVYQAVLAEEDKRSAPI